MNQRPFTITVVTDLTLISIIALKMHTFYKLFKYSSIWLYGIFSNVKRFPWCDFVRLEYQKSSLPWNCFHMITQWLEIADTGMMTTNTDTDADYRYNYNTIAEQLIGCKCSNSSQKLTHTKQRVQTSSRAWVLDDQNLVKSPWCWFWFIASDWYHEYWG